MTMTLLSGESLASQFSCDIFSFSISSHAVQANIKPTLVTISICMEVLTNREGEKMAI